MSRDISEVLKQVVSKPPKKENGKMPFYTDDGRKVELSLPQKT